MAAYILRRIGLMVPTLFGIILINFAVVQFAPGGPIEQLLAEARGEGNVTARFTGEAQGETRTTAQARDQGAGTSRYRGAQGVDPAYIRELERQFGFDRPAPERFLKMLGDYLRFDFGRSWFRDRPVLQLMIEKLPVSISLGLWSTLLIYLICVPLGIAKAVRDGSRFDLSTSTVILACYAIPDFLFAILLVVLFAGGSFVQWFPLRGLVSSDFSELSLAGRALDYAWHMVLPLTALVIGGFATLTLLTKNFFIEEISKQYVQTARAKGCTERRVLYGHVFRNAMLLIIAGLPGAFIGILFTGAVLIETIFSLDGLGLLALESALRRDYPVLFATLYISSLVGLFTQLMGDVLYMVVDPRIDFEAR
ncbi:MAG: microcin C ABC transporter permease YejB [Acetobacteraceae bacterium]|nr:microcin C ABC transporter permease YejB [Acetobacteraceae bacterium]